MEMLQRIIKNKGYISLVCIIILLGICLINQQNDYKKIVGIYDNNLLNHLEFELGDIIYLAEGNVDPKAAYEQRREALKIIVMLISHSPNIRFMHNQLYQLLL
ncbi:MAG: hypothetical protein AAGU27_21465, partial [Dehalobacterium sp.]